MTAPARPAAIAHDHAGRALFAIVLVAGIGLRAWQWLANPPLWLDELALTNGILERSFSGLFGGASDFAQAAPPGFLAVEWLMTRAFPGSDLAVRAPQVFLGCAALPMTWLMAREIVGERSAWLAAALVALAAPLVYMGSQVKPYAADAFFAPLILGSALRHDRLGTRGAWVTLVAAGAIGPLFSFGAVFANAGAAAFLLLQWRARAGLAWRSIAMFALWGITALASVILSRRLLTDSATAMMAEYWSPDYPPMPPRTLSEALWLPRSVLQLLYTMMGMREVWLFGIGLLAGAILAWRQRRAVAVLILTPIVAVLVAAALHQYPFGQRLMHWAAPIFAVLLTIVAAHAAAWLQGRARWAAAIPAAAVIATPILSLATRTFPVTRDNVAPAIERLNAQGQPGDALYVYWGAWHSWKRYGPRLHASLGRIVQGGCPREYPRGYLRELDQFRGMARVWLLFGRLPATPEHELRLRYLGTIGTLTDSLLVGTRDTSFPERVTLYRYDLSDPDRLARADAASFPVPEEIVHTTEACYRFDGMMRRGDGTRVVPVF